jgi:4-hydroxy-tetrahydrodipicolinate synthase
MFRGVGTAVITPFKDNRIDYESFEKIIGNQLDNGIKALIVLGTTGEAPTVTNAEKKELIQFSKNIVKNRVPLIIGTGTNSTEKTLKSSYFAFENGADGVLVVTPYYNKPTQKGLFEHYAYLSNSLNGPIIIYNVPSRTGVNILPETVKRCSNLKNIAGIKEASGDLFQIDSLIKLFKDNDKFKIWSGNDDSAFHLVCSGGDGVISVVSNVVPKQMSEMISYALNGDLKNSSELHLKMLPLMKNLFCETNPIPVKYAMSYLGYCDNKLRLPLCTCSKETEKIIIDTLNDLGIVK